MNILVLESEPGAAAHAVEQLESAGHTVVRCHEDGAAAFPCSGLEHSGSCPLDGAGVDVALTVRSHPRSQPTPLEDGVVCALKARVPVVVGGRPLFNPYERFGAEAAGDDDLLEVIDQVSRDARPAHSQVATDALHESLVANGQPTAGAAARVHRTRDGLRVVLGVPNGVPHDKRDMAAIRVTGALRAYDPASKEIDVSVEMV